MTEILLAKLTVAKIYCDPCRVSHEFDLDEIKALIWVLQAEQISGERMDATQELECLSRMLKWAWEPEMYYEHIESMAISDLKFSLGVSCGDHRRYKGPDHARECPLWAEEEE